MFSTIALAKNSKFTGKIVGTHQRIDQAARRSLGKVIPKNKYFPSSSEILHFEGSRGPDGLKRKSPGVDEPSHLLVIKAGDNLDFTRQPSTDSADLQKSASAVQVDNISAESSSSDPRTVPEMILDHRYNLVQALQNKNQVRAAFEAAWMAHMIVDGLTPAHHFPLSDVKEELMTDKEMIRLFGEPLKGVMHGRNLLETMRNNWLYWGAGGHMSKHITYEYGVLTITATTPPHALEVKLTSEDLQQTNTIQMFQASLDRIHELDIYTRFLQDNWTTEIARETRETLLPEMVRAVALGWYSAVVEAYHLKPGGKNGQK